MYVLVGEAGFKVSSETSELIFISLVWNKNLNMSLETQTKLKWSLSLDGQFSYFI